MSDAISYLRRFVERASSSERCAQVVASSNRPRSNSVSAILERLLPARGRRRA